MIKPIFANAEHEIYVSEYLNLMLSFVDECSSDLKYDNFCDVVNLIIEYHNAYGKDVDERIGNWNDWLMILPINLSVCCNGYFAGIETKRNKESLSTYKRLLDKYLADLVLNLSDLEHKND